MTEDILHFIWMHNAYFANLYINSGGEKIEIISAGEHNKNSGPDFFNAKLKIEDTIWAGNVEIHINASDWNKHGHHLDGAYDSVILHVVAKNDTPVFNSKGNAVKTIEIGYPHSIEQHLQQLIANEKWIPCAAHIAQLDEFKLKMWLSSLAIERLEQKTNQVISSVYEYNNSWEEAFYVSMARSFGLKINALPFELLAKSIPLKYLVKIRNNKTSIEATLFGQAGMLNKITDSADYYQQKLKKEYDYIQKKYNLTPISAHLWKFMRLRPVSFPTVRIAQLASLIQNSSGLFSKCMEASTLPQLYKLLTHNVSEYWETHYTFGKESKNRKKPVGKETIRIITLNTAIPFMFAYGTLRNNQSLKDKALNLLENIAPEKNSITRGFAQYGIKADNALYSQALVHLKNNYCDKQKCLFCSIGTNVLLKKATDNTK